MAIPKDPIPPAGNPTPPAHAQNAASKKISKFSDEYGHMTAKPMTFLGMHFTAKEAGELWNAIIQQVNAQIRRDEEKALKALRKLKKDSTEDD